jgi:EmrB/QacA subfamily drug resistance transporter
MNSRKFLFGVQPKWWVLLAVGVGSFMGSLDASAVNIILPTLHRELGGSVATIEWVVTIYLLVVCGLLLTVGRLGDLHGHKRLYILGFAIFTLGSAICGLAWSVSSLVAARVVQGIGAAILFSCSPAILTGNFPASERGQALGLQAIMVYMGSMAGPMLGGWLTDHVSWRAVFYVNVPVGLMASFLCIKFIPVDEPKEQKEGFDIAGAILFMAAFTSLLLGLNQGYERGWTSPSIECTMTAAAVLMILFVLLESRLTHPLVDLSLFRRTQFSMSVTSAVLNYIAVFTILFLMPFYLIQGRGLSASQAGLLMTIQPAVMTISAPLSGILSDRIGTRRPATLGMALLCAGLYLLSRLNPESSMTYVGVSMGLAGLGTGIFVAPNNSALMGAAPKHRQGLAAGVLATARNAGMVLGIGIAGAIFTSFLTRHTPTAMFEGIRASFLAASAMGFLGCLTSAVRKDVRHDSEVARLNVG